MIRIAIVDDQPVVRLGYEAFFGARSDFEVAASLAWDDGLRENLARHCPDVVVIDAATGAECRPRIDALRRASPRTRVLLCADLSDPGIAVQALEAGAAAIVSRTGSLDNLVIAALRAMRGDNYLDAAVAGTVVAQMRAEEEQRRKRAANALSVREEQVVRGLLLGQTNKEIARTLNLSEKTVKYYVGNLKDKMNAKNRLEIAMCARDQYMA
jgi:DNA-binding NarL/FixJ family response regulator